MELFFIASHLHVFFIGIGSWLILSYRKTSGLELSKDSFQISKERKYLCAVYIIVMFGIINALYPRFFGVEISKGIFRFDFLGFF
jgi:hypothetical protein